jgi:hypothetical protein
MKNIGKIGIMNVAEVTKDPCSFHKVSSMQQTEFERVKKIVQYTRELCFIAPKHFCQKLAFQISYSRVPIIRNDWDWIRLG